LKVRQNAGKLRDLDSVGDFHNGFAGRLAAACGRDGVGMVVAEAAVNGGRIIVFIRIATGMRLV